MKSFALVIALLVPSFSFAAKCPDSIDVYFGAIQESSSSEMRRLEGQTVSFKRSSKKRICQFFTPDVFLLTIELNTKREPYLVISRQPFDENMGYSMRVKLKGKTLPDSLTLKGPFFDHYELYYDQKDGGTFGKGTKKVLGYARFNTLAITMH